MFSQVQDDVMLPKKCLLDNTTIRTFVCKFCVPHSKRHYETWRLHLAGNHHSTKAKQKSMEQVTKVTFTWRHPCFQFWDYPLPKKPLIEDHVLLKITFSLLSEMILQEEFSIHKDNKATKLSHLHTSIYICEHTQALPFPHTHTHTHMHADCYTPHVPERVPSTPPVTSSPWRRLAASWRGCSHAGSSPRTPHAQFSENISHILWVFCFFLGQSVEETSK